MGRQGRDMIETVLLSRIQFAVTISFHILFPSITIALCWILFYFKVRFDLSHSPVWMRAYRFWVKIFALSFALGVVSGVTMSFQFGTNWPGFMEHAGNIAGPLLGYEVLSAFFLEATFLGVMLYGINRVPGWLHTLSTFIVAIGTTLSAFWIIALNSWMHTPTGFELRNGIIYPVDWWTIIFSPSMPYRLAHVLFASGLTSGFLVSGISAYRIYLGDSKKAPLISLRTGILMSAVLIPLQIFIGDLHGLNTLRHQPQKIAAIESVWQTDTRVPLILFAVPDEKTRTNHFTVEIPTLASLILTHDINGEVKGLNEFNGETPPVKPLFYGFRLMVGVGLLMLLVSWMGVGFVWRKKIPRPYLVLLIGMSFSGWIATLAGWYVTEIGRQPFLIYNILLSENAVTSIAPSKVTISLTVFILLATFLIFSYIRAIFSMAKKAVAVPEFEERELNANFQAVKE